MTFSLTSGNIGRAFEIHTTNSTYGEVFVARPLDRELLDHYTLRVNTKPPRLPPWASSALSIEAIFLGL